MRLFHYFGGQLLLSILLAQCRGRILWVKRYCNLCNPLQVIQCVFESADINKTTRLLHQTHGILYKQPTSKHPSVPKQTWFICSNRENACVLPVKSIELNYITFATMTHCPCFLQTQVAHRPRLPRPLSSLNDGTFLTTHFMCHVSFKSTWINSLTISSVFLQLRLCLKTICTKCPCSGSPNHSSNFCTHSWHSWSCVGVYPVVTSITSPTSIQV